MFTGQIFDFKELRTLIVLPSEAKPVSRGSPEALAIAFCHDSPPPFVLGVLFEDSIVREGSWMASKRNLSEAGSPLLSISRTTNVRTTLKE